MAIMENSQLTLPKEVHIIYLKIYIFENGMMQCRRRCYEVPLMNARIM